MEAKENDGQQEIERVKDVEKRKTTHTHTEGEKEKSTKLR